MEALDSKSVKDGDFAAHLARFGLSSFRPGQDDVISAVLRGEDCLCIMPTGGGKSLCYQLPAIARGGLTIVVSPLIALMKDQVDALHRLGIRATFINSSLSLNEQSERMNQMAAGEYELVYVAPERLRNARFRDSLREIQVQLLAVDEAHCISQWGHDFRPDYARLGKFRELLGAPQTIALTATATTDVRQDVVTQLQLRSPQVFVTGFARPNLRFEVETPRGDADKQQKMLAFLTRTPGAGIVYAATRKRCEELVELLRSQQNRPVGLYHGGLEPDDRRKIQDAFMKGEIQVMVATNAFGMGINKSDLRFVVHYNLPGSLEAYYQEAGRAGRDGLPSRCLLLYSYADRFIQEFFIDNHYPPREDIAKVYEHLRSVPEDPVEVTLQELKEHLKLSISTEGVAACEKILEQAGGILRLDSSQNRASFKIDSDLPTIIDMLPREAKVQRRVLRAVEKIVDDRRGEWVHVSPQRLLTELEMDREAVNRAMRELVSRLNCFDYIAPFRGRAIHVPHRDVPFRKLEIDFAELDRRKAFEYEKLARMVRYAETRRCRQWEILDYFGDPSKARCGSCDNCGGAPDDSQQAAKVAATPLTPQIVEAILIALSGVARSKARYGMHMIAKMLCGSKSAKVSKLKLDRLSTFGLLNILTQEEAIEFLDILLDANLLRQLRDDPEKPRLDLTPEGREVMRGGRDLEASLNLPKKIAAKLNSRPLRSPETPRADGSVVPPEVPSANGSGEAVASPQPPIVVDSVRPVRLDSRVGTDAPEVRPNHYWTWRLLSDGFTLAECLAIRGISENQVVDHLQRAADDGWPVTPGWIFSDSQLAQLEAAVPDESPVKLRALIRDMPAEISPAHVQLFVRCVRRPRLV